MDVRQRREAWFLVLVHLIQKTKPNQSGYKNQTLFEIELTDTLTVYQENHKKHAGIWRLVYNVAFTIFQGRDEGHDAARKFLKCFDILKIYSAYFKEVIRFSSGGSFFKRYLGNGSKDNNYSTA